MSTPKLDARLIDILAHALNCHHVSQHFDPLVACRVCVAAALREAVEAAVTRRDVEWSDALWPENPEGAPPETPEGAKGLIKEIVEYERASAGDAAVAQRDGEWIRALFPGSEGTTTGEFAMNPERAGLLKREEIALAESEAVAQERRIIRENFVARSDSEFNAWLDARSRTEEPKKA